MKKLTILDWIKSTCSSIGWKLFIWGLGITQEEYWDRTYDQEVRKRLFANGFGRRRLGNSTRIVDHLIQNFFINGVCEVYDHHDTREATRLVFNNVLRRLDIEHTMIKKQDISIDKNKFIIRNMKHELHNHKT